MPDTNFFWDPLSDNILQERDETGAVTAKYTAEPGLYGNTISQNRGGVESHFHYDAQGSTLAMTDDNQNVTDTFAYTTFGEVTERTGTTEVPFQYVGQKGYYTDALTGQIMARRKPYSPSIGRWLADGVSELSHDRPNVYRYANNAPNSASTAARVQAQRGRNLSMIPFVPRIKIVRVKKEGCLNVHFQVRFDVPVLDVPHPATDAVWVIQEVKSDGWVQECVFGGSIPHNFRRHFWEAFDMRPPPGGLRLIDYDDDYFIVMDGVDTKGSYTVKGIAKGVANVPLGGDFKTGTVPGTGDSPSTETEPWGWRHLPGVEHSMTVTWDCCCNDYCVIVQTVPMWAITMPTGTCPDQIPLSDLPTL